MKHAAVAMVGLAGCTLGPGQFSIQFEWARGEPPAGVELYASVRVMDEQGQNIANAGPELYEAGLEVAIDSVPVGNGRTVAAELRDAPGRAARVLYYGLSEPFDLPAGEDVDVIVRLELRPAPGTESMGSGVTVTELVDGLYVPATDVTLELSTVAGVGVDVSNTAGFATGSFATLTLADFPSVGAPLTTYSAPWSLEACPVEDFCTRQVFVRFFDREGYVSPTYSREVIVDRKPPAPVPGTGSLELIPAMANRLFAENLTDRLTRVTNGTTIRVSFTLDELITSIPVTVRAVQTGGGESIDLMETSGNGASFIFERVYSGSPGTVMRTFDVQVSATDKAGNQLTTNLGLPSALVVDTSPPSPPAAPGPNYRPLVYHRAPYGPSPIPPPVPPPVPPPPVPYFGLSADVGALKGGITVLVLDRANVASAQTIGAPVAAMDGSLPLTELSRADRDEIFVLMVDQAGNESGPTRVRDVDWVASFGGRNAGSQSGNPHRFDARSWLADVLHPAQAREFGAVHGLDRAAEVNGSVSTSGGGAWRSTDALSLPTPRFWGATAYDPHKGRLLMFGGTAQSNCDGIGGTLCGSLWSLEANQWQQIIPGDAYGDGVIPARDKVQMAFDSLRGELVVFSGKGTLGCTTPGGSAFCKDTWTFDGESWRNAGANLMVHPEARGFSAMAFHAVAERVVMFGGTSDSMVTCDTSATLYCRDTWEWDGNAWSITTATGPSARQGHRMVYDPVRARIVLFGGADEGPCPGPQDQCGDTWEYDGTSWEQRGTMAMGPQPVARVEPIMAFSRELGRVLLFGGYAGTVDCDTMGDGGLCDVLWSWSGDEWERVTPTVPGMPTPPGRARGMGGVDAAGRFILIGGTREGGADAGDCVGDSCQGSWAWHRGHWYDLWHADPTSALPENRLDSAIAPIEGDGISVRFGGRGSGANCAGIDFCNDTWVFNGSYWNELSPLTPPTPRWGHTMHWDPLMNRVVAVGGRFENGGASCDGSNFHCTNFWEFDLNPMTMDDFWRQLSAPNTFLNGGGDPGARRFHAAVFDRADDELVIYSGLPTPLADQTWALPMTGPMMGTWQDENDPTTMTRFDAAMAYDEDDDASVVFGGQINQSCPTNATTRGADCYAGDTWTYVDGVWTNTVVAPTPPLTPLSTPVMPITRSGASLVYIPGRGATVLFGGETGAACGTSGNNCNDTWEYDVGTSAWSRVNPSPILSRFLPTARNEHVASYDTERRVMVVHGGSPGLRDTWVWDPAPTQRPAHVARFSFDSTGAPPAVELRQVDVNWVVTGTGYTGTTEAAGARLMVYYQGRWQSVATLFGPDLVAGRWASNDPALMAGLVTGPERSIGLAVTTAEATNQGPRYASLSTDYVEVTLSYRLP